MMRAPSGCSVSGQGHRRPACSLLAQFPLRAAAAELPTCGGQMRSSIIVTGCRCSSPHERDVAVREAGPSVALPVPHIGGGAFRGIAAQMAGKQLITQNAFQHRPVAAAAEHMIRSLDDVDATTIA